MSTLQDIKSIDWQLSLEGAGNIVQGYDDVNQCIDVILRTQKGTDPLRPFFGSNIYFYIDAPVTIAIPNIKREIIEALTLWETRIEIVNITHTINGANLLFFINYKVLDDGEEVTTQLLIDPGGIITTDIPPQGLILEALIPSGWPGHTLWVDFTLDSRPAAQSIPLYGFSSPAAMLTWLRANWGIYGRWYLLPDRLIVFVRPGMGRTGALDVNVVDVYRYAETIPALTIGQQYQVQFTSGHAVGSGHTIGADTSPLFTNMATMLAWLNANWDFGNVIWVIENSVATSGDFDSSDFDSSDFNTSNIEYLLVVYTPNFDAFSYSVNAV